MESDNITRIIYGKSANGEIILTEIANSIKMFKDGPNFAYNISIPIDEPTFNDGLKAIKSIRRKADDVTSIIVAYHSNEDITECILNNVKIMNDWRFYKMSKSDLIVCSILLKLTCDQPKFKD